MIAPFPLSPTVRQAAFDLSLRFARGEPRVERSISEQGMSQGFEADRAEQLAELRRGSEGRDGPLIGVNLAVANVPAKEGGKLMSSL
jgi:hypothetical protein